MIDSHCHLNFKSLKNDLDNVISRSKENGISNILSINTNPIEFDDHINLIKKYNNIHISYGIHPQEVTDRSIFSFDDLENKLSTNYQLIGLGETGLDYYHSDNYKINQIKIFESHIEASKKFDLPLIIHQRNSENEIIEILNKYKKDNLNIVFHCFTGSKKLLNFCLDNNYFISLSGIITFKNANQLRETIKNISLNHLLVETDSPYLAPVPMRGKINEPSYIKHIIDYLSEFFSLSSIELSQITDKNFYKLFSRVKQVNYHQ